MANLTVQDVDVAVSSAASLGERLVVLISLRKRAILERQTATNERLSGAISDIDSELVQDASQAVIGHINSYRVGVEALIN